MPTGTAGPRPSRSPSRARSGIAIMVSVTATVVRCATGAGRTPAVAAWPTRTKANSPLGPSSSAISVATPRGSLNKRPRPNTMPALMTTVPQQIASRIPGRSTTADRSSPTPIDTKKSPSNSPLKGSMVTSISRRNSVSAKSRPARKAPSDMDRPLAAVMAPVPITTSRQAAMKNSVDFVAATPWNSGRSTSRPSSTISPSASAAGARVKRSWNPSPASCGVERTETVKSSGATARSWNSRTEKAVRPAAELRCLRSARTGMVTAVDDRARASPRTMAAVDGRPST